jgi:hypothetical protein
MIRSGDGLLESSELTMGSLGSTRNEFLLNPPSIGSSSSTMIMGKCLGVGDEVSLLVRSMIDEISSLVRSMTYPEEEDELLVLEDEGDERGGVEMGLTVASKSSALLSISSSSKAILVSYNCLWGHLRFPSRFRCLSLKGDLRHLGMGGI